ncbi:MAG: CAP domain-containing protein [Lachnospiraceae bacterium]|nr:CAP domain-containing protein [Lachnospiraceae bacterium]
MKQHIVKKFITAVLASALVVTSLPYAGTAFLKHPVIARADQSSDKVTLTYDVTVDNTTTASMLSAENIYRTSHSLSAFTEDGGLDQIAVERAKDIAIYYSHLRPDSTDPKWITVTGASNGEKKSYEAENIWCGGSSHSTVLDNWKNSSSVEGSQNGENLLSDTYTHVGIGHVVYNGQDYWVQVFSSAASTTGGAVSTGEAKVSREVSKSIITSDVMVYNNAIKDLSKSIAFDTITVGVGESVNLPTVKLGIITKDSVHDSNATYCPVTVEPVWTLTASNAATLNGTQIKGELKGTANLTLSFSLKQNYSFTVPVNVTSSSIEGATMQVQTPANGYVADGTEKTPSVVLTLDGKTLVEDKDYILSYSNNKPAASITKAVEAKVVATGRGNYTGTREETFVIGIDKGGSLNSAKVELKDPKTEITYDGKEKKPEIVVTLNGITVANSYYDVAYTDNINVGKATVTVTAKSGSNAKYTGTATGTFEIKGTPINKGTMTFTPTNKQYSYTGAEIKPEPAVKVGSTTLEKDKDYKLTYKNNKQVGKTAEVIATGMGNYSGTLSGTFEIIAGSLKDATVTCTPASFVYNGTMQIPQAYTVTVPSGTGTDPVTLKAGTDYAITSYPTTAVDAGTYEVTLTGLGSFKGTGSTAATLTAKYTIEPKKVEDQLTEGGMSIGSVPNVTYTGNAFLPQVQIIDSNVNSYVLEEGVDYTRTDSNNTKPGTASITFAFKGNYTGSTTVNYTIKPKASAISSLKSGKRYVKATWKKVKGITGYQLQYARSSSMRSGKKSVTISKASTKSLTIKKLISKKKYYYRIRTYYKTSSGKKVYSSWSAKKSITVK